MNATRSGLIGYWLLGVGAVCVDCDVYPPDSEDIRQGDDLASERCGHCGRVLSEVDPLAGKVDLS